MRVLEFGLTGDLAVGKSLVGDLLEECGATIINEARLADRILDSDSYALHQISKDLGSEYILPDGTLDRARLGMRVWLDAPSRRYLSDLCDREIRREAARLKSLSASPLIGTVSRGLGQDMPFLVTVATTRELQEKFLCLSRGYTLKEARALFADHTPTTLPEPGPNRALVWNTGSVEDLRKEVSRLYSNLLALVA